VFTIRDVKEQWLYPQVKTFLYYNKELDKTSFKKKRFLVRFTYFYQRL